MYKKQQDAQIQRFYSAATCKCRQLSRSTNKLHSYTVTRPPAEADSYRVRCPRGTTVLKFKHFVPRPPATADSYRVRPNKLYSYPRHAATCGRRQLSRSTNKLYTYTVTRPPADAGSYRARCRRGTKIRKFKHFVPRPPASADSYRARPNKFVPTPSRGHLRIHFVPRPPASADSYRVRPTSFIPTPSRGHLRTQAAIALNVIEARRSANSNVLVPRPPASADSYRARPNKFFLHRHAATCGRRQLSR
jgi:hypothetical protein